MTIEEMLERLEDRVGALELALEELRGQARPPSLEEQHRAKEAAAAAKAKED